MMLGEDWREAYINFIRDQRLPVGMDTRSTEAARVMRRSKGFILVDSKLYRRGARSGVLMKCVTKEDGYCGRYMRVFAATMQLQECWWGKHTELVSGGPLQCPMPRILCGDVKTAKFFGKQSHIPAHSLITIPPSLSFACWSLDMIGPFTTVLGGFTHVLVAIDKFTKWIEYKPIAKLTPDRVVDFISDILHRFGFPSTIITDLGSNFTTNQF
jgi:hypothetical protein